MVKMVVFDLDGTLINSLTDLAISVNYGLKLNGLEEKPVENYKTYVGNGRKMNWSDCTNFFVNFLHFGEKPS